MTVAFRRQQTLLLPPNSQKNTNVYKSINTLYAAPLQALDLAEFLFTVTILSESHTHALEVNKLKIFNQRVNFSTKGEIDFVDLTDKVAVIISKSQIRNGLAHIFAPHATGVLVLTEHDWNLLEDIKEVLKKLFPKHEEYQHPSNAHSHLRSMFLPPDKTLPVIDGKLVLGTWQSLLFVETDVHPRQRTIIVQVMGE